MLRRWWYHSFCTPVSDFCCRRLLHVLFARNVFFLLHSFLPFLPLALNRCGSVFPLDVLRNLALREMSISQQPNKWRQESVGCLHIQGDYYPAFLSLLLAACSEVSAVTDERCQQQHCCYGPVCFLLSWSLATKQENMYVCMYAHRVS